MARGVVQWFNSNKGFGFIRQQDGKYVFVHHTAVVNKQNRRLLLIAGEDVEFETATGRKGLRAINVRIIPMWSTRGIMPSNPPSQRVTAPPRRLSVIKQPLRPRLRSSAANSPPPIYAGKTTALMRAAQEGDLQGMRALLEQGVNPNEQGPSGVTALMFAVCKGNLNIIKFLLQSGANPNVEAFNGQTALTIAHDRNQKHCLRILSLEAQQHKRYIFSQSHGPYAGPSEEPSGILYTNESGNSPNRFESSKGFAFMRRDNGQYGSFPVHDDYSDEGDPSAHDNEYWDK